MIKIDLISLLAGGYFVLLAFLVGGVIWQLFKNKKILAEVGKKANAEEVDSLKDKVDELLSNQAHLTAGLGKILEVTVKGAISPFVDKIDAIERNEEAIQKQIRENGRVLNEVLLKLQE